MAWEPSRGAQDQRNLQPGWLVFVLNVLTIRLSKHCGRRGHERVSTPLRLYAQAVWVDLET